MSAGGVSEETEYSLSSKFCSARHLTTDYTNYYATYSAKSDTNFLAITISRTFHYF